MMDKKLSWVYMTSGSPDEARELGKMLLEKNLAACVNVLEGMYSLYRWEGEIQEDQETVLIAKTRHELVNELTKAVQSVHSYDCPCIIELPIQGGNPEFLKWIYSETDKKDTRLSDEKAVQEPNPQKIRHPCVIIASFS